MASYYTIIGTAAFAISAGIGSDAMAQKRGSAPTSISPSEKQEGAKAHPQLLAQFGGTYPGSQASYVTRVGQRIAVQSGLSNAQSDFTISLLNSPVNNAFAIPGGYVYVTRQLLGLMNDEAELAGVLGHEVGHVAARHGQKRSSAATRNSILGALGQVLVGAVTGGSQIGGLVQQGIGSATQYFTLKYSRTQEYEADDLGIRYLRSAGYDPNAMSSLLASLAAQNALDQRATGGDARSVPEWASTHPDPASRVARARKNAGATGANTALRSRDVFLTALNGTLYGDDPKQGVIDGAEFRHPELKLAFTAPRGYGMSNGAQAVTVSGTGGQTQFSGAPYSGNLDTYINSVLRGLAGEGGQLPQAQVRATTVNGLKAATSTTRANTQSGQVDVTVFAYEFSPTSAYHFVSLVKAGSGNPFSSTFASVRRLSTAEAAAIKPRRISVVTVKAGDTPTKLAQRMAYTDYKLERFLTLNALTTGATLQPGSKVKIVVNG